MAVPCGGGGGGGGSDEGSGSGDLQPAGAEPVHSGDHVILASVASVLQQAEGAEALSLWLPQEPQPQDVRQLA